MATNVGHEVTSEDVRKIEAQEAKFHGGKLPVSRKAAKQLLSRFQKLSEQESKAEQIDRVKANLPLPDQPVGGASADLQSADQRTVNVGSGGVNVKLGASENGLGGGPATAESSARVDGEELRKPTQP
ncbi:uncharacterized protein AB675_6913 [Cyphellophora attinorum]|uniref:Uncharacterized protein n=1 Tax=Cyphellophora attinorum TaxID=1664694 RepID=A0A0N1HEH1_9EURO|nr:uncharacterized protein AB675_6913 [Phialophora attinorum]KPI43217.1 hypothetical protein AB675_6913 [Phialophora attinorum]